MVETEKENASLSALEEHLEGPVDPNDDRERNYELPDGWSKKVVRRLTGKSGESGRIYDVYLIPPTKGKRLRSVVELMKYIQARPTVPIDARVVNMERPSDITGKEPSKLSPSTLKLISFIEKIRNGEKVNIEDFIGRQSKQTPSTPDMPATGASPVKGGKGRKNAPKKKVSDQFYLPNQPVSPSPIIAAALQNQLNLMASFSNQMPFQPFLMGKTVFNPYDGFRPQLKFSLAQVLRMESLLSESRDPPTPDQISDWSSELGVKYTDLQEWMREKWFSRHSEKFDDDDIVVEDEDQPGEDDVIVPAQLCHVVMDE